MSSPLNILLDNPVLVKHVRSRLRPAQAVSSLAVVLCICLLIVYTGLTYGYLEAGPSFMWLFGLSFFILAAAGGQQVASAVGGAKDSGIMDFHRVSPQPPVWLTVGFLLGAPIREYAMFALVLPFALFAAMKGPIGLFGFFEFMIPLVMVALLFHSLSMLTALVAKKAKSSAQGTLILLVILIIVPSWAIMYALSASSTAIEGDTTFRVPFFAARLPWMAYLSLYVGTAIFFFLIACTRKMKADRMHAYSKPEALAFMAIIATLAVGALWQAWGKFAVVPGLIYILMVAGVILAGTVTPDLSEYQKGIRRALRVGRRRAPVWSDAAANQWAIYGLAAITALGATIGWEAIEKRHEGDVSAEQVLDYTQPPPQVRTTPVVNGNPRPGTTTSTNTFATGPFSSSTMSITTTTDITHSNGIATITTTTVVKNNRGAIDPSRFPYSQAIAIGVFTVAYFGFGAQYLALKFGKRGDMYYRLFLFFLWMFPLLGGAAAGMANLESKSVQIILAVSPLAGVALSSMPLTMNGPQMGGEAVRFAALLPSIAFAFIFHFLLTAQQRRIDRTIRHQIATKKAADEFTEQQ